MTLELAAQDQIIEKTHQAAFAGGRDVEGGCDLGRRQRALLVAKQLEDFVAAWEVSRHLSARRLAETLLRRKRFDQGLALWHGNKP